MTDKKFKIVLLREESDLIVVSVSCSPRVPKGPRIRYDLGEIVEAIRAEIPHIGDYVFGATLINYYPDKTEAQFGFRPKKRQLLLETKKQQPGKKKNGSLQDIVRPFDDLKVEAAPSVEEKNEA